jgi:hypothetical protein
MEYLTAAALSGFHILEFDAWRSLKVHSGGVFVRFPAFGQLGRQGFGAAGGIVEGEGFVAVGHYHQVVRIAGGGVEVGDGGGVGIGRNVFARHITPGGGCSAAGCHGWRSGGSRGALRQQQGGQHQQNKRLYLFMIFYSLLHKYGSSRCSSTAGKNDVIELVNAGQLVKPRCGIAEGLVCLSIGICQGRRAKT